MNEELEQTVIETVSTFSEKLIEAASVVSTKLIDVAPDVADAMLTLVQVKGLWEVSTNFICMMIFAAPLLFVKKIWRKVADLEKDRDGSLYGVFVLGLLSLLAVNLLSLGYFLDFYNWVSIFYPEGAIALRALSSVGIEL